MDQDGVQQYEIVSGNVGEAFDLHFDKKKDTIDLVVKGSLDREKLEKYSMILVASDNGQPPKSASMTLTVQIQDLNDSPPIFSKQRYVHTFIIWGLELHYSKVPPSGDSFGQRPERHVI